MDETAVRRTSIGNAGVRTHPARALLLGVLAAGVVVFLLGRGVDPVALVGVVVVGLAVGAVAALLSGWPQLGLLLLTVPAGWSVALALGHWTAFLLCVAAVGAGFSGVLHTRAVRDEASREEWRREQRGGGEPVRRSGDLQVVWDEAKDSCETFDPSRDDVLGLVDRLDGDARTTLTLRRGAARLDVAGDATGRMLVMWTDDTSNNHSWYRVQDDSLGDDRVEVAISGRKGRFEGRTTTTATAARTAAAAFVDGAPRPDDLAWWNDRHHVWAMRPPEMND